jgi:hypothetical protein
VKGDYVTPQSKAKSSEKEIKSNRRKRKMKSRFPQIISGMAAILVMSVITVNVTRGHGVEASQAGSASLSEGRRSIEGVWRNQVSITDCNSGNVFVTFPGLLTYHFGGTMSETTGDTLLRSPGSGTWEYRGRQSYTAKFMFYTFNSDGTPSGFFKVFQNIEISEDGNALTDHATYEIHDVAGNVVSSGCATAIGTRFE